MCIMTIAWADTAVCACVYGHQHVCMTIAYVWAITIAWADTAVCASNKTSAWGVVPFVFFVVQHPANTNVHNPRCPNLQ